MATVKLSWTNADDTSDHSYIWVYRYESSSEVTDAVLKTNANRISQEVVGAAGSAQTYEDSGAELGKSYCYGVYSANGSGVGDVGDKEHIDVS